MSVIKLNVIVGVIVVLLTTGCASVQSLKDEPKTSGTMKTFSAKFQDVLEVTRGSLRELKLSLESEYRIDNKTLAILATGGFNAFSWGDNVRVTLEEIKPTETIVWIISKRKHAMDARGSEFASSLFSSIQYKLLKTSQTD